MKNNPNKVVMAGPNNFCISYADSKKHHWMNYESSAITKDIQSKIPNRLYQEKLRLSPKQVKAVKKVLMSNSLKAVVEVGVCPLRCLHGWINR